MTKPDLPFGCALTLVLHPAAVPLAAQTAPTPSSRNVERADGQGQGSATAPANTSHGQDIVVTAQRRSQHLQDVPVAVSAFTAAAIERRQTVDPLALQQSLPNVTFTKTSFTSSSFTIRGIGDLCVGVTCDSTTAIHVNDMPLLATRLFETDFLDLERVEGLRGPQGTLSGHNATSGVVNVIGIRADMSGVHATGEVEDGSFDSKHIRAMLNRPVTDTIGVRVAGTWPDRDGRTRNVFTGSRIDGRDLYALRGTLSWVPDTDPRVDLIAYRFTEKDDRSRVQKQRCHRDSTGVLGCAPNGLADQTTDVDTSHGTIFVSGEFLTLRAGSLAPLGLDFASFALGSIYGDNCDLFTGFVTPPGIRTVSIDVLRTYSAKGPTRESNIPQRFTTSDRS